MSFAKTHCKELNSIVDNLCEAGVIKCFSSGGKHLKAYIVNSNNCLIIPCTPSKHGRAVNNYICTIKKALRNAGVELTKEIMACFKLN